ncbi:hypothetical protein [Bacillus sp. ISL-55]|uniref:hypothetical protein n=1 Tax=Bacillus sp. ISL-55 TaxID=2819134 RepID=UPI001BE65225|nr:hypothetical protein [Bacillus sp. ISL-55]MBT2692584.1 hypothetical protein [Bacillus sp. ISL-55]
MIHKNKTVSTTRGRAKATLHKIKGETIYLEFQHQEQTRIAKIRKEDFNQAYEFLSKKGKVRQTDLSTTDKRYVLGAMKELVLVVQILR